jgi:hypothetical protein
MESQTKMIKAHLEKGHGLTSLGALKLYDCLRLSARISELKASGFHVEKQMIELTNGKKVAKYYKP